LQSSRVAIVVVMFIHCDRVCCSDILPIVHYPLIRFLVRLRLLFPHSIAFVVPAYTVVLSFWNSYLFVDPRLFDLLLIDLLLPLFGD